MASIGTELVEARRVSQLASADDIYVSTRVRLARNIAGFSFPQWADDSQRVEVRDMVLSALSGASQMNGGIMVRMDEVSEIKREILKEEHLVSREFVSGSSGGALSLSRDSQISVMINEEDHIRMQYIGDGVKVAEGWRALSQLDKALESELSYAFSVKYGYLTACPTNVGTGLRVSVMMHLPGLSLMGEIDQVVKGLSQIGLQVRGLLGEGSEAYGNMYQISNRTTLGLSEEDIIVRVGRLAEDVAVHERNARARMMQKKRAFVADRVARSVGILKNCRLIASGEALGFLSGLRLGIECGMIKGISAKKVNDLVLAIQPAHLQRLHGAVVVDERRDEIRADILREQLKQVRFID